MMKRNGYEIKPDANLRGANLRGANLQGANLQDANLQYANLQYANLQYANLRGANLRVANLRDADLRYANLRNANLRYANLQRANLRYADLHGADLQRANLRYADLYGADLQGANLHGADLPTAVVIQNIDQAILDAINSGGKLDMDIWHTCDTTHCRAGWAIHLAGDTGRVLEDLIGPNAAGALIYAASGSHPVPDWLATNEEAMEDMRKRAGVKKYVHD